MRFKWMLISSFLALLQALPQAFVREASAQHRGGQLSFSSMQQVVAYDPLSHANRATTQLMSLIFETLVVRNPLGSGVLTRLAESFQREPSAITFALRRDVRWHNGEQFTAEDVKFTTELLLNPKSVTPLRDEYTFIQAVEVIDPYTVRFRFKKPIPQAENFFVGLPIVSRTQFKVFEKLRLEGQDIVLSCRFKDVLVHAAPSETAAEAGKLQPKAEVLLLERKGAWLKIRALAKGTRNLEGWVHELRDYLENEPIDFYTQPIGNGPYRFDGVDLNGNIVLAANENYYGAVPWIDKIRRRRSSDKNTMINRLASEVLDLIPETPFEDLSRLHASGVCQTLEYPALKFSGFAYNFRNPFLAQAAVRRALTEALDRQELLRTFYQGQGTVLAGPYSPHSWGYDFELEPLPYNPEESASLIQPFLAKAAGTPLKLIVSNDRNPEDFNLCQAYASILKKLGLTVDVQILERHAFNELLARGDFDIAYLEWIFDYAYNLRPLFYPGAALNFTAYDNPQVRAAFDDMETESNPEARYEKALNLQRLLRDDCPYTFLWATKNIAAVNRKVSNIKSSNIDPYSFFQRVSEWWITESEN